MKSHLLVYCMLCCALSFSQEKDNIDSYYRLFTKSDSFYQEQMYDSAYHYAKANFDRLKNSS
ncbi:MAG: hypothetical protein KJO63_00590, partial [Maribacter sp.]|nr:hypothetical protein [Maribacter sp.]